MSLAAAVLNLAINWYRAGRAALEGGLRRFGPLMTMLTAPPTAALTGRAADASRRVALMQGT